MDPSPLNDQEKRHIVTEAIKLSSIPLEKLLDLLRDANVTPEWDHMVLPNGRTVATCRSAFEVLFRSSQPQPFQPMPLSLSVPHNPNKRKSAPEIYTQQPSAESASKRRQSRVEIIPGARELAPKPSNGSPSPMGALSGKPLKKRGRPSKADQERKHAEAIARGEVIAPTMTTQMGTFQAPSEEPSGYAPIAPSPSMVAPATTYESHLKEAGESEVKQTPPGDSPGKKKRKPPPRARVPLMTQGQSSFHILPPIDSSREYAPPQALASTSNPQLEPIATSTERLPSTPAPYAVKSQPPTTTQPRPDI